MEKRMGGRSSSQQNVKDLIDIIRMVKCEKMGIYSITHDEVCEVNVRMDSSDKDYLFVLRMNTLFPSDYETKVKKIGFRLKNLKSAAQGKEWNENLELESSHYKVKNDEKFELYINIPKELEHMIDIIYVLDSVFPTDSIGSDYCCEMYVVFEFKDRVCAIGDDAIELKMQFEIINEGKDTFRNCKCFQVENKGVKRIQ